MDIEISKDIPSLDLNKVLIKNPASTFYGRVKGTSMKNAGIDDDDLLVIDKSLGYRTGAMAVCVLNGGFTLKFIENCEDGLYLVPANEDYKPIKVDPDDELAIWGIVSYVIKKAF